MGNRILILVFALAFMTIGAAALLVMTDDHGVFWPSKKVFAKDSTRESFLRKPTPELLPKVDLRIEKRSTSGESRVRSIARTSIQGPEDPFADTSVGIDGQVIDEKGLGIPGVEIEIYRGRSDGASRLSRLTGSDAQGKTDASGRFRVRGLRPFEAYEAYLSHDEYSPQKPELVDTLSEVLFLDPIRMDQGGVIEGVLIGGDNRPVIGASVSVECMGNSKESEFAEIARQLMHNGKRTKSGEGGRYRIAGLESGHYRVRARAAHLDSVESDALLVSRSNTLENIDLRFPPGEPILGLVLGAGDSPVVGASVRLLNTYTEDEPLEVLSDEYGQFHFKSAARRGHTLTVEAKGYARAERPQVTPRREPIVVRLLGRGRVSGVVMDKESRMPVGDFSILVERAGRRNDWTQVESTSIDYGRSAQSFNRFVIEADPGEYRIRVKSLGYTKDCVCPIRIQADTHVDDFSIELSPECLLRGQVIDQMSGEALVGATLSVEKLFSDSRLEARGVFDPELGRQEISTNDDGRFLIRGLSEGYYNVQVKFPGLAPKFIPEVEITQETGSVDLAIEVGVGGLLFGQVSDAHGAPRADAVIQAIGPSEWGRSFKTHTDANGHYFFEALPEGLYVVTRIERSTRDVFYVPSADRSDARDFEQVEVFDGESSELDIDTRQPASIGGVVLDAKGPVPGARIIVNRKDQWIARSNDEARSDDFGRFLLEDLDSGEYRIKVLCEGRMPHEETLNVYREYSEITVQLSSTTIRGHVTLGGLPVRDARVTLNNRDGRGSANSRLMSLVEETYTTDQGGWFEVEGVGKGEYDIEVDHEELVLAEVPPLVVETRGGTIHIELPMTLGGTIRGELRDAMHRGPLRDSMVQLVVLNKVVSQVYTDRNGAFEIRGLQGGPHHIQTQGSQGYRAFGKDVDVSRGAVTHVTLQVSPK